MSKATINHPAGQTEATSIKQGEKNTEQTKPPTKMLDIADHEAVLAALDYRLLKNVMKDHQYSLQHEVDIAYTALNAAKRAATAVSKTRMEVAKTQKLLDEKHYLASRTLAQSSITSMKVRTKFDIQEESGKHKKIYDDSRFRGDEDHFANDMSEKLHKLYNDLGKMEGVVTFRYRSSAKSETLYLSYSMVTDSLEKIDKYQRLINSQYSYYKT
jgi:hypothetical protein